MKLSKKKRIRRKQQKKIEQQATELLISKITRIVEVAAKFAHYQRLQVEANKFPLGGVVLGGSSTKVNISPNCKTEFTVTSKGFKEFHQQTES